MQIFGISIVCSVLRFQKRFLQSLLGGFILMDSVTCLKHLTQDYDIGFGFFMFGSFKYVGLFLLFAFGLKSLYSAWFSRVLVWLSCDLRGKSGKLNNGFCSIDGKYGLLKFLEEESDKPLNDLVDETRDISNSYPDSDRKKNKDYEGDDKEYIDEDCESDDENNTIDDESDVSALRKLIKIEQRRANAALAELEKERAASATAAEEAMAMILRLQNEKSLIEIESCQYQRLAKEKQIHDQEVIRSLQWLVSRLESEMSLLQNELKLVRRKLNRFLKIEQRDMLEGFEESPSPSSGYGCTEDVLENVLYSSLDLNLSAKKHSFASDVP